MSIYKLINVKIARGFKLGSTWSVLVWFIISGNDLDAKIESFIIKSADDTK